MTKSNRSSLNALVFLPLLVSLLALVHAQEQLEISVPFWTASLGQIKTTPSIHVVPNPYYRRGSPIHDNLFDSLKSVNVNLTSFVFWFPYPALSVAELHEPQGNPHCVVIPEKSSGYIRCSQGYIESIEQVFYGNPTGRCGEFKAGSCDNLKARGIVEKMCLKQQLCTIDVTSSLFSSECENPILAVQARCSIYTNTTSWNFEFLDEVVDDFLEAQGDAPFILDFSVTPKWMMNSATPPPLPYNFNSVWWSYSPIVEFRDPTYYELAQYNRRLLQYYFKGEMIDEYGRVFKRPGGPIKTNYVQVLNEPAPKSWVEYTKKYDAIVGAVKDELPEVEFLGLVLEQMGSVEWYEYFLNMSNHASKDIPVDWISFHFYASPKSGNNATEIEEIFPLIDGALQKGREIVKIRDKLLPSVKLAVNELGVITQPPFSDLFWIACSSYYAYGYTQFGLMGVNAVHSSQLLGYISQFPAVTMVDSETGKPNARLHTLNLLIENIDVHNDEFVTTLVSSPTDIFAQAVLKKTGEKMIIVGSKRSKTQSIKIENISGATFQYVDISTGNNPPAKKILSSDTLVLQPFSWGIIHLVKN